MKFSKMVQLASVLDPSIAIFFKGPPGVGKSQVSRTIGAKSGPDAVVIRLELTGHGPEDVHGVPFPKDGYTTFLPPEFLSRLALGAGPNGTNPKGALILEDITQAAQAVKQACYQLVQERSMGHVELSPDVRIILTGNRTSDKTGARDLPKALANRVMVLDLQPDLDEWMYWAASQGLPAVIGGFLKLRPSFFAQTPDKACKENGQFATPRSWAGVGRCYKAALGFDGDPNGALYTVVSGLVGVGVATEFCAFIKLSQTLPDPQAVLDDPAGAMPDPPTTVDQIAAMTTALGEHAAQNESRDKKIHIKLLLALAHVSQEKMEGCASGVCVFQACGGAVDKLVDAADANKKNPKVIEVLRFFAEAVA